jgi:hypothetical protein
LWFFVVFIKSIGVLAITATTSSSPSSSLQIEAPSRDNDEVGDGVDVVGEENGAVNEELASVATTPILFQQPQQRTTAAAARKKSPLLFTASAPDTTNNNDDDDANSNGNMATIGVDDHGGDEDEESQYRKWKATGFAQNIVYILKTQKTTTTAALFYLMHLDKIVFVSFKF